MRALRQFAEVKTFDSEIKCAKKHLKKCRKSQIWFKSEILENVISIKKSSM